MPVKCETKDNFCYFNIAYGLNPNCENDNSSIPYDFEMLTNSEIKTSDLPEEYKPKPKQNKSHDKSVKSKDSGVNINIG